MAHRIRRGKPYEPIKPIKQKSQEEQHAEQMGLIKRFVMMVLFGAFRS